MISYFQYICVTWIFVLVRWFSLNLSNTVHFARSLILLALPIVTIVLGKKQSNFKSIVQFASPHIPPFMVRRPFPVQDHERYNLGITL